MKSRKTIAGLLILSVVIAAFLYASFSTHTVEKRITAPLPPFRVAEQVTDPANIIKWMLPFAADNVKPEIQVIPSGRIIRLPNDSMKLLIRSIFTTDVHLYSGSKKHAFSFSVIPDTSSAAASIVTMHYKTTWLRQWFGEDQPVQNALNSFDKLKDYVGQTKNFYGFEIRPVTVADTAFLFLKETHPIPQKREAMKKMYEKLISYAEKTNAGYNGTRIFYSVTSAKDITLFTSIGVTNRVTTPETDSIQYKLMPWGKNLLEASYQGPLGESWKAFSALEQFKLDHNLTSMAIPFQKILSEGYDFADDQVVQLKIYYPIF